MTRKPLTTDQVIAFQHGRTTVRLQCVRPGHAYTVVVERGTWRVEALCDSFAAEHVAHRTRI